MVDRSKVACFSGHRKMPQDCAELRVCFEKAIISLIEQGVVFFGSGAALGFDQIAASTVLRLKEIYPHIRLVMVLPCPPEHQSLKRNILHGELRRTSGVKDTSDMNATQITLLCICGAAFRFMFIADNCQCFESYLDRKNRIFLYILKIVCQNM